MQRSITEEMNLQALKNQIQFIFKGAAVKRYHGETTIKEQTVGAHSFGVMWLCYVLTQGKPSANLLLAASSHDLAEWKIGDVPAPTKRGVPGLREQLNQLEEEELFKVGLAFHLTSGEQRILKMADAMEGLVFCRSEQFLGNHGIKQVFQNFRSYITEFEPLSPHERDVLSIISGGERF